MPEQPWFFSPQKVRLPGAHARRGFFFPQKVPIQRRLQHPLIRVRGPQTGYTIFPPLEGIGVRGGNGHGRVAMAVAVGRSA